MNIDTETQLSTKTVRLHWLIAIIMIALLGTGVYMVENEAYVLYDLHKSIGLVVFVFAIYRVAWRLSNGWPSTLGSPSGFMHGLAKTVHYALLISTVLLPISGIVMSAMGGYGVPFFGFELVSANPNPDKPGEMIAINGPLAGIAHDVHGLVGNIIIFIVLLHIVGALKHHIIDKDGTLRRMLGQKI